MRIRDLVVTTDTNGKEYYTELARILESVRLGTKLSDGRNLKEELNEEEKKDIEGQVMEIVIPIAKSVGRKKAVMMQMDYSDAEEFTDIMISVVYENFHKYNAASRLESHGKTYELGAYFGILAQNVVRKFIASERNLPLNTVRNLGEVRNIAIGIATENQISIDMVTAEQVAEKLSDKSISIQMISDLLGLMRGNISINDIPDTDDRLKDPNQNVEESAINQMNPETIKALDEFFDKFSNLELFILNKEAGFFGENVRRLTAKEISYQDFFVKLAEADCDGSRNIETGNVHVKRPGRNSGCEKEVLVEDVRYVKEKFYQNKVAKIKRKLIMLADVIDVDDARGYLEDYCMKLWNSRTN